MAESNVQSVDHDAPTDSPEVVVAELHRHHAGNKPPSDQRANQRYTWCVPLTLVIEEGGEHKSAPREIEVVAADISLEGFAFCYRQYLALGTHVRVQFDSLPKRPRLVAVVRNCRLLKGVRHRIGVQFIDPAQENRRRRRTRPAPGTDAPPPPPPDHPPADDE